MKKDVVFAIKILIFSIVVVLSIGPLILRYDVFAQGYPFWSPPQPILGLGNDVLSPYLVADSNKTVHAFTSDWVGDTNPQLAIMYLKWSANSGWTNPIDIILPRRGDARVKGAFMDPQGLIHLAFFEGDDVSASIYHASVYAANAGQVRAWSSAHHVGSMALAPDEAVLVGNSYGTLIIAYLGDLEGRGIYISHSQDSGKTWSDPTPIYFTDSDQHWPSSLNAYMGENNQVHLVWTVRTTDSGGNEKVYYAGVDTQNFDWEEPVVLAELEDALAYSAAIIEYQGGLFAIYHDGDPTTRWMRRSQDGGNSWSNPVRLFDHVGSNGPASFVIDGNGDLHMFFGNRIGYPSIHGLWHSIWKGNNWSPPEAIISGPPARDFDPGRQQAVVSQGNVILVVWIQELGRPERNGAWYSYQVVNAPELPIFEPSIQESEILPTIVITPSLNALIPTPTYVYNNLEDDKFSEDSNAKSLSVAILFSVLLVSVIIVTQRYSYIKRR